MATTSATVFNNNFFSPVGFKFQIRKLPIFEHFVQKVNLPAINAILNQGQSTPFINIPQTPDAVEFDEIEVQFKLDEFLANYCEVYDWLTGITFPENFSQYAKLAAADSDSIESDATLLLLDSSMDPVIAFKFKDVFPVALGGFEMNTTDTGIEYITVTARFKYTSFKYEKLKTQ